MWGKAGRQSHTRRSQSRVRRGVTWFAKDQSVFSGLRPSHGQPGSWPVWSQLDGKRPTRAVEELHEIAATRTERRQHVQVTSPKQTSGSRRYAVVSTPTCDLNRTGRSSGITREMAILRQQSCRFVAGGKSHPEVIQILAELRANRL